MRSRRAALPKERRVGENRVAVVRAISCPRCDGHLDDDLRCDHCRERFVLAIVEPDASHVPSPDHVSPLLRELADATDEASLARARTRLSIELAKENRRDLLLALWTERSGLEADLWRGMVAALDPQGATRASLTLLARVHADALACRNDAIVSLARTYLGLTYAFQGRFDDALALEAIALAGAIQRRDAWAVFRAAYSRSFTLRFWRHLDPRPATEELDRVGESIRGAEPRMARVVDLARAFILLHTVERPSGVRMVERLLAEAPTALSHDRFLRLRARMLIGAQEGDTKRVWEIYGEWRSWLSELNDQSLLEMDGYVEADLALTLDDVDRAASALDRADRRAARFSPLMRNMRRDARLLRAEVRARRSLLRRDARRRRAGTKARLCAQFFGAQGLAWRELRWRLLAGEIFRRCGARGEARIELERAAALSERLEVPRLARRAAAELRGIRTRSRGRFVAQLTERQEAVVALIARGATNREIARQLRIAEATVARHVSNALIRLGRPSRHELADVYHGMVEDTNVHSS